MVMMIQVEVVWVVTQCSVAAGYQRFGGPCRLRPSSGYFSKTCCTPFAASFRRIVEQAVLTSELPFHGWKSPEIA
jgi:hypothetical protein